MSDERAGSDRDATDDADHGATTGADRDATRRRGRDVYDWWSGHQRLFGLLSWAMFGGRERALRDRALDRLLAGPGDRVLDVGCGSGPNFRDLAAAVGSEGLVVGVDYSEGMIRRADERARTLAYPAAVVRGDAARLPFTDATFDRAYSTLALSAMPDHRGAIAETYRVLRPGGRFVVFDAQPIQSRPLSALNPLVNRVSAWATNWHPDRDTPAALRERFEGVDVATFNAGTAFVAVAEKG